MDTEGEVFPAVADVTRPEDIQRLIYAVEEYLGQIDILVNNAGGPPTGTFTDFDDEAWEAALQLNLMSTINLVYAFLPSMKRQKWGRVLASTSSNVKHLLPMFPLSNVSRIGVVAFVKTFAAEFGRWNITANVLAPGFFMTEPTKAFLENQARREGISCHEALEKLKSTIPTRSIGDPKDYGALAAFLASEYTSFITGEIFLIDGGKYAGSM